MKTFTPLALDLTTLAGDLKALAELLSAEAKLRERDNISLANLTMAPTDRDPNRNVP